MTQNCYFWISTNPWNSSIDPNNLAADKSSLSGSSTYDLNYNDMLPDATLFAMMWIRGTDGNVVAFESTESPSTLNTSGLYYNCPTNPTQPYCSTSQYVQVYGYTGITTGVRGAALFEASVAPPWH